MICLECSMIVFQNVLASLDAAEMLIEENMDLANINQFLELLYSKKQQLEDVILIIRITVYFNCFPECSWFA